MIAQNRFIEKASDISSEIDKSKDKFHIIDQHPCIL